MTEVIRFTQDTCGACATQQRTAEFVGIVDREELAAAIEGADPQSAGFMQRLASSIRG